MHAQISSFSTATMRRLRWGLSGVAVLSSTVAVGAVLAQSRSMTMLFFSSAPARDTAAQTSPNASASRETPDTPIAPDTAKRELHAGSAASDGAIILHAPAPDRQIDPAAAGASLISDTWAAELSEPQPSTPDTPLIPDTWAAERTQEPSGR